MVETNLLIELSWKYILLIELVVKHVQIILCEWYKKYSDSARQARYSSLTLRAYLFSQINDSFSMQDLKGGVRRSSLAIAVAIAYNQN